MTAELGFSLAVSGAAKEFLAREGYDPAFGARPLKRAIQRQLQDPLALRVLEEDVPEGAVLHVAVEPDMSALTFEVTADTAGGVGASAGQAG